MNNEYSIYPLGDSAATIDFGNSISPALNQKVLSVHQWLLSNPFEGLKDHFVAYSSVTALYDPVLIKKNINPGTPVFDWVAQQLRNAFEQAPAAIEQQKEIINIPVCYEEEFGVDLVNLSIAKKLTAKAIVEIHCSRTYKVYMIGFLPGFSYMGEVDEQLVMPRKPTPVPVVAGSVGIVSFQTGIYPLDSPGGWHIIGRTPLQLFNQNAADPVLLHAGDEVRFYAIGREEFTELEEPNKI